MDKAYKGAVYKALDSISFHGIFRLRRIYTMKEMTVLPEKLGFHASVQVEDVTVVLNEVKSPTKRPEGIHERFMKDSECELMKCS